MLRRGITSFFDWDARDPIPEVKGADFRGAVYAFARLTGGRVISLSERSVTPNFHRAIINLQRAEIALLCNGTYPILTFAVPPVTADHLVFSEHPDLVPVLTSVWSCEVMTPSDLERTVTPADLEALDHAEREQFSHWIPTRVGDVIFNWWD